MRIQRSIPFLLFFFMMLAMPVLSSAQIGVSIRIAPPRLVAYSQPVCPQEGYLWTPGYWAYGQEGYFWVPGTWVEPPTVGFLWTPGYWGWGNDAYSWNEGYWGPTVGFYGGINYGYGYGGYGYQGGYWRNNQFNYNRSVNNVDTRNFHNTYEKSVSNGRAGNRVSYNGGSGGTTTRATAAEMSAANERHSPATAAQTGHQNDASQNHELLQSVNHGKPRVAATSKPGEFTGKGVMATKGATGTKANENKAAATRANENKAAEKKSAESNKASENKAAATRANENKANEKKSAESNKAAENKAAATRANENKTAHVKPVAARPETKPVHTNVSSQPAHQAAPHAQSAPKAATQHQTAAKPEATPKSEPSHQSEPHEEKKP